MSETSVPEPAAADTPAAPTRKQTALMKRLARMREHDDFPRAMEHVPPTEEDLERARGKLRVGGVVVVVGGLLLWQGLSGGDGGAVRWVGVAVAALVAGLGIKLVLDAVSRRAAILSNALERRVALVADRRSETTVTWFGGRTTYFFQLEFDDGTNGEFRYPGRGVSDDLLVKGSTGVAFLRGDTLLAWKNIKV